MLPTDDGTEVWREKRVLGALGEATFAFVVPKDIAQGAAKPVRAVEIETVDVLAIRRRLNLSQDAFARRFGLSPATLRDWEQGRRSPDLAARTLLTVIDKDPGAVVNALEAAARTKFA